ncbi:MAG: TIGR04222 domain-containing membrane protein [Syntrophobacteraceae bacterium]
MSYNPFDLRGPEFLAFFLLYSLALIILLNGRRKRSESEEALTFDLAQDPYQIAYLRGGSKHLIQSTVFSLLDRKLLKARDSYLRTTDPKSIDSVRRPLEKAILQKYLSEDKASTLFSDPDLLDKAEDIGDTLRSWRLIPGEKQKSHRVRLFCMGLMLLWAMAGTKIYVAISRGRFNIVFLVILSVVFTIVLWKIINKFRTFAGDNELKRLKEMFSRLYKGRKNLRPHSATNELVLLAALFGLSALPPVAAEMVAPLHLRQVSDSGSGCGSGCGGSSDGGGSCGGGCGGGCGGCG